MGKVFFDKNKLTEKVSLSDNDYFLVNDSETSNDETKFVYKKNISKNIIWGYVNTYDDLPLAITGAVPQIGDIVGVNTSTGTSFFGIGNKRDKGFYKRIDLSGVAITDYGTSPYAGFPLPADQTTKKYELL